MGLASHHYYQGGQSFSLITEIRVHTQPAWLPYIPLQKGSSHVSNPRFTFFHSRLRRDCCLHSSRIVLGKMSHWPGLGHSTEVEEEKLVSFNFYSFPTRLMNNTKNFIESGYSTLFMSYVSRT